MSLLFIYTHTNFTIHTPLHMWTLELTIKPSPSSFSRKRSQRVSTWAAVNPGIVVSKAFSSAAYMCAIHTCECLYMCESVCACACGCVCSHVCKRVCVCVCVRACLFMCMRMRMCMCMCICVCVRACMCAQVCSMPNHALTLNGGNSHLEFAFVQAHFQALEGPFLSAEIVEEKSRMILWFIDPLLSGRKVIVTRFDVAVIRKIRHVEIVQFFLSEADFFRQS